MTKMKEVIICNLFPCNCLQTLISNVSRVNSAWLVLWLEVLNSSCLSFQVPVVTNQGSQPIKSVHKAKVPQLILTFLRYNVSQSTNLHQLFVYCALSGLGSSPGRGHCVLFLGKILNHSQCFFPLGNINETDEFRGVTLRWTSVPSKGE